MRISDWSSDVCSSDLQTLLIHIGRLTSAFAGRCGQRRLFPIPVHDKRQTKFAIIRGNCFRRLRTVWRIPISRSSTQNQYGPRSEEHTSELQSLMRISYAVFCLKKKKIITTTSNAN